MIPDRFLIDPASASLISLLRPTAHAPRTSHGRLRAPTFAAQELRLWNPMAPAGICEPSTRTSLQPSQLPTRHNILIERCSQLVRGVELFLGKAVSRWDPPGASHLRRAAGGCRTGRARPPWQVRAGGR